MTYASIEEAWGGVSGSNMLSTPLHQRMHPIHQQQKERFANQQPAPSWKNTDDKYQCSYGSQHCNQVFDQNQQFNNQKKQIAAGIQPFLPGSPQPQNYTMLPQYPWYPWAKHGYLMYPPEMSQMFYNNPWGYNPQVAQQIAQRQMQGTTGPMTPIGPYQPQGFMPLSYRHSMDPPGVPMRPMVPHGLRPVDKNHFINNRRTESFTDPNSAAVKSGMVYFIFFLIALAVILVIAMICLCSIRR